MATQREITDAAAALIKVEALYSFRTSDRYRKMNEIAAADRAHQIAMELDRAARLLRAVSIEKFPQAPLDDADPEPTK